MNSIRPRTRSDFKGEESSQTDLEIARRYLSWRFIEIFPPARKEELEITKFSNGNIEFQDRAARDRVDGASATIAYAPRYRETSESTGQRPRVRKWLTRFGSRWSVITAGRRRRRTTTTKRTTTRRSSDQRKRNRGREERRGRGVTRRIFKVRRTRGRSRWSTTFLAAPSPQVRTRRWTWR